MSETKNAQLRDNYNYYKTVHRCTSCGKQDAFTLNGRIYCSECNERVNIQAGKDRERNREEIRKRDKERYHRLQELGLCPKCKRELEQGYKLCKYCRDKNRKASARYKRKKRGYDDNSYFNKCKICNKRDKLEGHEVCQECYDRNMKTINKINESPKDNSNHPWKISNNLYYTNRKLGKQKD